MLIDGSRASASFILKLEIAFDLDAADHLTVEISDNADNCTTRLHIAGDETCLSTESIGLAENHFRDVLNGTAAMDESKVALRSLVLNATAPSEVSSENSTVADLRTCLTTLKPMGMATVSVSVSHWRSIYFTFKY
ncbi:unnamed protein product [Phytophthora lilii]|uniref:Unnamed protein product n=1 Tax=Phytophthora lilii TaxID=2077276 RepID=A0A9W6TVA1_9STRA|nr:unnamed protein product [Phytophthora lilii]